MAMTHSREYAGTEAWLVRQIVEPEEMDWIRSHNDYKYWIKEVSTSNRKVRENEVNHAKLITYK